MSVLVIALVRQLFLERRVETAVFPLQVKLGLLGVAERIDANWVFVAFFDGVSEHLLHVLVKLDEAALIVEPPVFLEPCYLRRLWRPFVLRVDRVQPANIHLCLSQRY